MERTYYCISYLVGDKPYDIFVLAKDELEAVVIALSAECESLSPESDGLLNERFQTVALDGIKTVSIEDVDVISKYTPFLGWSDCLEGWFDKVALLCIKEEINQLSVLL